MSLLSRGVFIMKKGAEIQRKAVSINYKFKCPAGKWECDAYGHTYYRLYNS
jgi:hypothetical protein